jgi:hypothetical protein
MYILNEAGKQAWNQGEDVYWPDHVDCIGDLKGLAKADFS